LAGLYAFLGLVALLVSQGSWSQKGEPIRWALMGGGATLLAAAVLLVVRRPWSWWAASVSLTAAVGAFAAVTVAFVSWGDPNRMDPNTGYIMPLAASFLILVWMFAVFAAICGFSALGGLLALLLPGMRRDFRSPCGGATSKQAEPGAAAAPALKAGRGR
jgi:hypothetical protein